MDKPKLHIRKILLAAFWLLAGVSMVVVLVAAIRRTNDASCSGAMIKISGANDYVFLNKGDLWRIIGATGSKSFKGKPIAGFDLRVMEEKLEKNSWVSKAELFFDQDKVLQVHIQEREPLARLFTSGGNSVYIDSAGKYLPLAPGKPPVRLPVFTGMPEKINVSGRPDSLLLAAIKGISHVLSTDSFWSVQISQVNLNAGKTFEMVPLLGHHIILFGDGTDCDKKFHRLGVFYKEVLAKTGFDYYQAIDVQFDKQVIGIKGSTISTSVDKKIVWRNFADTSLLVSSNIKTLAITASPISQSDRKASPDPSPVITKKSKQPKAVMKKNNKHN